MYHLMNNLPVFGTLGVVALLAGPLARLPIDLGAWFLEMLVRWMCESGTRDGYRRATTTDGEFQGSADRLESGHDEGCREGKIAGPDARDQFANSISNGEKNHELGLRTRFHGVSPPRNPSSRG
jgi:hypothetical protein